MGFNKLFIPKIATLEKLLNENGTELFYRMYCTGFDVIVGSSKSIKWLVSFKKKYQKK